MTPWSSNCWSLHRSQDGSNDFDVQAWARPEFLERAAEEVLKEEWARRSWSKLPEGGGLEVEGVRLG